MLAPSPSLLWQCSIPYDGTETLEVPDKQYLTVLRLCSLCLIRTNGFWHTHKRTNKQTDRQPLKDVRIRIWVRVSLPMIWMCCRNNNLICMDHAGKERDGWERSVLEVLETCARVAVCVVEVKSLRGYLRRSLFLLRPA